MSIFSLVLMIDLHAAQAPNPKATTESLPKYNLNIKILPEAHRLEAVGTVQLPAANTVRGKLLLALSELMSDFTVEVLQPVTSAGPAKLEKNERSWERPGWGTTGWIIHPPRPIPAGTPVVLRFSYTGDGGKTGFGFYLGPEGSFGAGSLTAWYPEIEEDDVKVRLRGIRGTGILQFSTPPGYTVYAMGVQRSPAEEMAQGAFRFEVSKPIFFSFAVGKYTVLRRSGTIPVSVYLLRTRENIERLMEGCSKVLDALAQEFGPYPFGLYPQSGFAIVEVPTEQADRAGFSGASVDGFVFGNSTYFDQEFNTAFYGHEIGHQWWGGSIRRKGSRGAYMLDEGMAQYGSLRTVEKIEGADAAEKFRRTGYPGWPEYCGFTYLLRAAAGFDHPLSDLPPENDFLSRRVGNSKGMLAWDMLSRTVGRPQFSRILQTFSRQHAFQRVTWEAFLKAIEDGAGKDLTWFYNQWFEQTGAPDWKLSWEQEGRTLRGIITQSPPHYRATVEVQVEGGNCQRLVRAVEISGPRTGFTWLVEFGVKSVTLDPHFLTLHWTQEYRTEAMALLPYTKADVKQSQGQATEAYREFAAALERVPEQDRYGLRFMLEYGLAQILIDQNKMGEAKTHIQAALASPTRRADVLPWVYVQLATVAKKLNDEATLRWAVNAVVTADTAAGGRTGAVEQARSLRTSEPKN